ncbi:MAG: helix-turn-helix transcriptional regulator [Gemmatimonadota bacterium]
MGWHAENFSQESLSTRLGRTQSWCSKIERGERSLTVGDAYLLAALLDVGAHALVGPPNEEEQAQLDRDLEDLSRTSQVRLH